MISGFRCEVDENCTLLGYYAVTSGNKITTTHCVINTTCCIVTQNSAVLSQTSCTVSLSLIGYESTYNNKPHLRFDRCGNQLYGYFYVRNTGSCSTLPCL